MAKVLVTRNIPQQAIERVRGGVRGASSGRAMRRSRAMCCWSGCRGVDGIYCLLTERIDAALLDAAGPQLKVVSTMSVGYDHVDLPALRARGVALGNTPGVLTETTADLALALLLAAARRLPEAWSAAKDGTWGPWQPEWMTGRDVHGSTVGIVGLGRIGAAVARRLLGFGCRIVYSGPRPRPELAEPLGATYLSFEQLLAESDFVSIHCPLNDATRHLFGAAAFAAMKPTAILINTSRGPVVDQEALYQALQARADCRGGVWTLPRPSRCR